MADFDQVDVKDLPPRLAELAHVIGLAATLRLVERRGGTRVYVPEVVSADHWLGKLIGTEAFARLVKHHPRDTLELDRGVAALRAARDRQIVALAADASTSALALQFNLTQRQVFTILARDKAPANEQPDLFKQAH